MARAAVTAKIDYPSSDGLPMAESDSQRKPMTYAIEALDTHFRNRRDVYVSGNLLLYHQEGNDKVRVAPDVFVVFGTAKHDRSSYLLWQEGKAPDFVLEIASESTWRTDSGTKRDTYAEMGVSEYWQVDPTGAYLRPPLQGFQLVEGTYQPIVNAQRTDGILVAHSEVLGLELRLNPDAPVQEALRFYDPVRGEPLRSLQEAEQGREEAEQEREEAERGRDAEAQARRGAEARLQESETARKTLEAQLRQLERRLRHAGQEGNDLGHGR